MITNAISGQDLDMFDREIDDRKRAFRVALDQAVDVSLDSWKIDPLDYAQMGEACARSRKAREKAAQVQRDIYRLEALRELVFFAKAESLAWERYTVPEGYVSCDGSLVATSGGDVRRFPLDVYIPEGRKGSELGADVIAERPGGGVGIMVVRNNPRAIRETEDAAVREWCHIVLGRSVELR